MVKNEPSSTPSPRKKRRGIAVLPTLFTLGNCLCGFASLHYASSGMSINYTDITATTMPVAPASHYAISGYLIFAAMIFDMFDGFVARITRSTSDFGAELDSLADMVSFGVAPAYLALNVISAILSGQYRPVGTRGYWEFLGPNADSQVGNLFWIIGAIYVACTALRLARFNIITKHGIDDHMVFRGMPSPGAAGVVASTIIFFETLFWPKHTLWFNVSPEVRDTLKFIFPYLIPVILLIAALLMVSRFTYAHLINRFLRGRKRFRNVVWVFLLVMVLVWQTQITALIIIYVYAVSAPAIALWRMISPRKPAAVVK